MKTFWKKYWPQIVIFVIVAVLGWLNYKPGTFLTGWDTLHPEFDFNLNFGRLIEGVWREEQGFGAVAGHSHMADLPRVVFMWILHFVLPLNALRYAYIFFCLLLGPLGIISLLKFIFKNKNHWIPFLGSLFYLFNLSTVQQFFVPFEMFPTQYAFLPWIILFSLKYLQEKGKKNVFFFVLFTLLATPQAYAAHLWYAFFGVYVLFLIVYSLLHRGSVKKSAVLIVLTLLVNAFWLLPNIYFIATSSDVPRESKQNRLYSQEYRLRNREHGYLKDVALVKGFYFSWTIYNFDKNRFEYLMHDWRQHVDNPFVQTIGYLLFSGVILGVILSFVRKNKLFLSFLPFFLIPSIILMNHTPPFSWFFDFLLRFSLFEEALRFVFTKFSILIIFAYTLFFALFLSFIAQKLNPLMKKVLALVLVICLVVFTLPLWRGQLISDKMRLNIPKEYFQFWNYMKDQPEGSVLSFPLYNFAGWSYYDWGYQGAGFIWFGLKQPILDRDSDRWSRANEQSFREFHFSTYSRQPQYFLDDLNKYNVGYILWDKNVITYSEKNRRQIVYQREIQNLIDALQREGKLIRLSQFGDLQVFKVIGSRPQKRTISTQFNLEPYVWGYKDWGYATYGDYVNDPMNKNLLTLTYPYRGMIEVSDRVEKNAFAKFSQQGVIEGNLILGADAMYALNKGKTKIQLKNESDVKVIHFQTKNSQAGIHLDLSSLPHQNGYFLLFKSKNVTGLPLRICLLNLYSNLCDLYDELSRHESFGEDYFYLPPTADSLGYGLSIDNISYGDYDTVNELVEVRIISVPQDIISQESNVYQPNPTPQNYFVVENTYHPAWSAYQNGEELKEHVLVNNWANGWRVDDVNAPVEVVFWPQRLEYIGFGLLILAFVAVLVL